MRAGNARAPGAERRAAAGTAQDAAEAARRQAFAKWMQGEAMTPQETRLVNELWNTDPAKASEYWAAGQFLNTGAPTEIYEVLPLDKGNVDNDRKSWRQSEIDVGNLYPEYQAQNLLLEAERFRMARKEVPDQIITKQDIA